MTAAERLSAGLVESANGCLVWTGYRTPTGYGHVCIDRRRSLTHRLAWELVHGPIAPGVFICHKCDNPPCCNVDHLFAGTPGDNNRDRAAKGRGRNALTYTEAQLDEVARLRAEGLTVAEVSARTGISGGHISKVCRGLSRAYREVTP